MIEIANDYMKTYDKDSNEYKELEKYTNEEYLKKSYDKRLDKYKQFGDKITDVNVIDFCRKHDSADYHIKNGILYIQYGFDTPFRAYKYPKKTFTNKDKLLKWLSTRDEETIGYYDENNNFKWVPGYTRELINRINDYFSENGEDNLFIKFG